MCAAQKLSCKHVFFMHKIKNMSTVRELWQAQIEQGYEDWAVDADVDGVSSRCLRSWACFLSRFAYAVHAGGRGRINSAG